MIALFSQRKGIRPVTKALQRESIDDHLRNRLWSGLQITLWDHWYPCNAIGFQPDEGRAVEQIVKMIWFHYFKLPIDTIPEFKGGRPKSAYEIIRSHFFEGEWWQVYDLIEFIVKSIPEQWKKSLIIILNNLMQAENSAYRIIGDEVVEITDDYEIEAIESALDKDIMALRSHLSQALNLLSDRKKPDYRNSIKESISAVESICRILTGLPKATLGDCIKEIKKKRIIHPAFEQALLKLYGYACDEGGIRHALAEDSNDPSYSDAKFMLVASSAFLNFILTKASELGITMQR